MKSNVTITAQRAASDVTRRVRASNMFVHFDTFTHNWIVNILYITTFFVTQCAQRRMSEQPVNNKLDMTWQKADVATFKLLFLNNS